MSLHQEREKFIQEVQNRVKNDLEENGLALESVSISNLKAARQGSFGVDDVFGAQVARAGAAGAAIANTQIKMFGAPEAADSILRMMSFAEGMNDVIGALPPQVRQVGGQFINSLTQSNGKANGASNDTSNGQPVLPKGVTDLLPQLVSLVERALDVDALKGQSIIQALDQLDDAVAAENDKPLVNQARAALSLFPALAEVDFEEAYTERIWVW